LDIALRGCEELAPAWRILFASTYSQPMRFMLLLMVIGCGKAPPADCEAMANEAGVFLTTMDHEPNALYLKDVTPVVRADLPIRESQIKLAPVVIIKPTLISYNDKPVLASELVEKLKTAHDEVIAAIDAGRVQKYDSPDPQRLDLVIDQRAPWHFVTSAVVAIHTAGFDHVTIVFRRPSATPPPPHTRVDDEIAKLMADTAAGGKATALAAYTRPNIESCPPLVELFGQVSAGEQGDLAGSMLKGVGPALIRCKCAVDPAEMKSLFWGIVGNPHPLGAINIELDPKATQQIALAKDVAWSDANKQLRTDAATLWIAVSQ